MRALSTLLLFALITGACSETADPTGTTPPQASSTTARSSTTAVNPGRPARCPTQLGSNQVGRVMSDELDEISGAVVSRNRPGVIWVHNDSGSDPVLHAVSEQGAVLERVELPDLTARDWEDMAIGPGSLDGVDYLYLADIGDNRADRGEIQIHRIPEPAAGTTEVTGGETLRITYSTGPAEAETLIVDFKTGDLVIAGKAISGDTPIFLVSGDVNWDEPQTAALAGELQLGTFATATGGDADDTRIVIRSYDEVFLWERSPGQPLDQTLLGAGCRIAAVSETQGEAIALTDSGFYTLSEGLEQPIYLFSATP